IASKSFRSSFANVTLYRGAMSSPLYFEDDNNRYHAKIRIFKFYIVLDEKISISFLTIEKKSFVAGQEGIILFFVWQMVQLLLCVQVA
ncbi:MAG: hypothetical protein MUO63_14865, partial [Desulfobulbaceae bacterium]|nr:hypothetical protein [Desulfobulbaceae bacterium]